MATGKLGSLYWDVNANTDQIERELQQTGITAKKTGKKLSKSFEAADKKARRLTSGVGLLKGAILAVASGAAIRSIININKEFENLQLTLDTVFGSASAGQAAMDQIKDFATKTPFDIQTLSKAFIQLKGAGLSPTEEMLTVLGDAASATTNKLASFEALVRITTRSVGGGLGLEELEQLVSNGIPVYKILQEQIGKSRLELSELGQTAEGAKIIMDGLMKGLDEQFGGGMARAADTLDVALSNAGISGKNLILELGEGGLTDAMKELAEGTGELFDELGPIANIIGGALSIAVDGITLSVKGLSAAIALVGDGLKSLERDGDNTFIKLKQNQFGVNLIDDLDKRREAQNLFGGYSAHNKDLITENLAEVINAREHDAAVRQNRETFKRNNTRGGPNDGADFYGIGSTNIVSQTLSTMGDDYEELATKIKDENEELKKSFEDFGEEISDVFADSLVNGENLFDGLESVAKRAISNIISKMIETQLIAPALTSFFPALFGGGTPAFGSGAHPGSRASGGPVVKGSSYFINEHRGRGEIFTPSSSGHVTSRNQMNDGGIVINNVVNASSGVQKQDLAGAIPAIEKITRSNAEDLRRRRGGKL